MPVKERKLRADAQRNRDRIVAAAREITAREGEAAQIEEIAEYAGVGVGTVYRHFPTKEALLDVMVRERFRRFVEIAAAAESIADPFEALETALRSSAEAVEGDLVFQLAMMKSADGLDWEGIEEEKEALAGPITRIIERGIAAGSIRADAVFDDFPMLTCGITATMHFRPSGADWRRHLEIALAGLRPPPAEAVTGTPAEVK